MTGSELANFIIDHFAASQWDHAYAFAPVSERWYTADLAAGLLRHEAYSYPRYRFYGEESYSLIAKYVGSVRKITSEDNKIPDLTLIDTEEERLIFVVEAKIVVPGQPDNLTFNEGRLGDQMKRAARLFPEAATYGLVIVIASHARKVDSIPAQLISTFKEIAEKKAKDDIHVNSLLANLEKQWSEQGNRKTPTTLEKDFKKLRTDLGANYTELLILFEIEINNFSGQLAQIKNKADGIEMGSERVMDTVGEMQTVQFECEKIWSGHGSWVTNGIEAVPKKERLLNFTNPGPKGVVGLGIGLWLYQA